MTTLPASALAVSANGPHITSVADIVRDRLPAQGKRPAIRYDDGDTYRTLNYLDYLDNVRRAIQVLHTAEAKQQIVCTFVKNRPEWDMLALATVYTGNILFPLDTKMNDAELAHLLELSPPDVVLHLVARGDEDEEDCRNQHRTREERVVVRSFEFAAAVGILNEEVYARCEGVAD